MTESDVLQSMVLSFRLTELQKLMIFAGRNKSGRKVDLQTRALDLVRLNSGDINMKIRELSSIMYKQIGSSPSINPYNYKTSATSENDTSKDHGSSERTAAPTTTTTATTTVSTRGTRSTRSRVSYAEPEDDEDDDDDDYEDDDDKDDDDDDEEEEVDDDDDDDDGSTEKSSSTPELLVDDDTSKGKGLNDLLPSSRKKLDNPTNPTAIHSQNKIVNAPNTKQLLLEPLKTKIISSKIAPKFNNSTLVYPPCPDVKMMKLPFYKVEATLLKPSSLNPSGNTRFQDQTFSFHLTPSQANGIAQSSYRDNTGKVDYKRQIQMRFCLNETSCAQDDHFPSSICVKVNGRSQSLPNPIPTNKPGIEPKRPPKPINITALCKLSATVPNYLKVSWAVEAGRGFCVAIYYVDKLSSDDLIKMMKDKGVRHPDYTRAIIKDKLNDRDCEIATTSCKVSLACPLGKMRMSLPCRAATCDHLQCFDARLYIQMNERKPKWICPVCNQAALYDNLMIDGFFSEVLNSPRLPSIEHEIVLHNDATWSPLPSKCEQEQESTTTTTNNATSNPANNPTISTSQNASSNTTSKTKVETFSVDDDDDDEIDVESEGLAVKSAKSNNNSTSSGICGVKRSSPPDIDCITLDDSDDDDVENNDEDIHPPTKRCRPEDSPISLSDTTSKDSIVSKSTTLLNKEAPLICLDDDDDNDENVD